MRGIMQQIELAAIRPRRWRIHRYRRRLPDEHVARIVAISESMERDAEARGDWHMADDERQFRQ